MATQMTNLTQSKFYSPAFNAAIFDGPLRIYFAQYQEPFALRLYFRLQEGMKTVVDRAHNSGRELPTLFIMLYPTEEMFRDCFEPSREGLKIEVAPLGSDYVLGVRGPLREEDYDSLASFIDGVQEGIVPQPEEPASQPNL